MLIAGGLWPVGIAHESSVNVLRNYSYSYDVMRKAWAPLPLPPFEPGRTQGACLSSSLVIISGGDGGNVGSRVMRLSKPSADQQWRWDTSLPSLPPNAARFTAVRTPLPPTTSLDKTRRYCWTSSARSRGFSRLNFMQYDESTLPFLVQLRYV